MQLVSNLIRFLSAIVFSIIVALYWGNNIVSQDFLSLLVILCSLCQVGMALTNNNVHRSGTTIMFLLYNVICHNGFVIAYYFNSDYEEFKSITSMDFLMYTQSYQNAILISNIVLFVFVFCLDLYKQYNYKNTMIDCNKELSSSGFNKTAI